MCRNALDDLSYARRTLAKRPLVTTIAVITLALGIGVTTTLVSLVRGVLLRPLPYPGPEQLVRVWDTNIAEGRLSEGIATGNLVEWRRSSDAFDGIAGWYVMGRTLRTELDSTVVQAAQVTRDFFPLLRTSAAIGRTPSARETERATFNNAAAPTGSDLVVVLSDRLYRRRFGGDPSVLGRSVYLERRPFRVIGVMPPGFDAPAAGVDLWIPWSMAGDRPRDQHYLGGIARLKAGVTLADATASLNIVATHLGREHPETNEGWGVRLVALHEDLVGNSRQALLVLLGAVGVVLLMACVNIAILQLALGDERRRDTAVRAALGASRARIAQALLVENLLLAFIGGALGVLIAVSGLDLVRLLGSDLLPRLDQVALDLPVLLITVALTSFAGLAFGLVPALTGSRVDLTAALDDAGQRTTLSRRRMKLSGALVVVQVASAVTLLAGAGLLTRSFARLTAVDPGFDAEGVVVAPIFLSNHAYRTGADTRAYYQRLTARLASLPGVEAVGGATALPMSPLGPDFDRPVWRDGDAPPPGGWFRADIRMVTTGYFDALGIRLRRGRAFDQRDHPNAPRTVVISDSLGRSLWPHTDPVGEKLVIDYSRSGTYPYQVVGVVGDVRFRGLRSDPRYEVYLPHAQRSYLILNVAVRTSGDAEQLAPTVARAVLEVDPDQPAHSVVPLTSLVASSIARERFALALLGTFAALALALASLGVYGVLSRRVNQRRHEIGIRMALGATSGQILRMVAASGATLTATGVAFGILAATVLTRLLGNLLFGISPTDARSFAAAVAILAMVAFVACWIPARRAAETDAVMAIRD